MMAEQSGNYVIMVMEDYYNSVQSFDLSKPTTDQDYFEVDIYSYYIIAIKALRFQVMKLDCAITQTDRDHRASEQKILQHVDAIMSSYEKALDEKAKTEKLQLAISNCRNRQFDDQITLHGVLELYYHQFTYFPPSPAQRQQILCKTDDLQERQIKLDKIGLGVM